MNYKSVALRTTESRKPNGAARGMVVLTVALIVLGTPVINRAAPLCQETSPLPSQQKYPDNYGLGSLIAQRTHPPRRHPGM